MSLNNFSKNNSTKFYKTQAGIILVNYKNNRIINAEFVKPDSNEIKLLEELKELNQESLNFEFSGTDFQVKVWQATLNIPAGKTLTYQELAQKIGNPKAFRAVANALGQNKIAYFIPCHRVVRKNGELGGYKWGIDIKKALLIAEKS